MLRSPAAALFTFELRAFASPLAVVPCSWLFAKYPMTCSFYLKFPKDQDDETGKASFPGNTSYDTVLSQVQTPTSVVYVTTSNK